jgi:hypothetical protein
MPDRAAPRLKFTGTIMQYAKWKILLPCSLASGSLAAAAINKYNIQVTARTDESLTLPTSDDTRLIIGKAILEHANS